MGQKLLAVDDDFEIARLVCLIGQSVGYETQIAVNHDDFKKIYMEFIPNVIVLDILMPGMDGFEFLRFFRDEQSTSHIIILSGSKDFRTMAGDLGRVYGLSVDASLAKPFRIEELRQILESIPPSPAGSETSGHGTT